uniref:IgGFc-binding protein N-terminal domain-containing protein n=1 Tax=Biomphalaria glabrata TaxID=6526 RepID=A0A2C9M8C0_BIOGL
MEVTFLLSTSVDQVNVTINTSIKALPLQKTIQVVSASTTYFVVNKAYQYERSLSAYWAFKLMGENKFIVMVFLSDMMDHSGESFLVLPVASWGRRYYIVTLNGQPIHLVLLYSQWTTLLPHCGPRRNHGDRKHQAARWEHGRCQWRPVQQLPSLELNFAL